MHNPAVLEQKIRALGADFPKTIRGLLTGQSAPLSDLLSHDVLLRNGVILIDTSTAAGKAFLDMLGVFAEFETNLRRERQLEGIAKAKAAGVYKGRKASIDAGRVRALKAQGMGPSAIAKHLKIGRASVYRVLER